MQEENRKPEREENPLGVRPIPGLLAKYAIPSIVSMVVMSLYNIVDQIFIGHGVGHLGNSATTVAFPLMTVMLAVSLLIGNGAAALTSLELGRGNSDSARKIAGNAFTLLLAASISISVLTISFLDPILNLLGATEEVMPYARDYIFWIAAGAPFAMIGTGLSNIIRADGSPRFSMTATLLGALLNCFLDPLFIFVFDMGVAGAAIATILSQAVALLVSLYYMTRKAKYTRLAFKMMRLEGGLIRRIATLGSSSFATQMAISVFNVVMNNVVGHYGELSAYGSSIPLAAVGIVTKINAIMISAILGVAIGAQPILGYNYGAKNFSRVRQTYLTVVKITFLISLTGNILFITNPQLFITVFGDSSAEFNRFAAHFMRIFLCLVVTAGIQIPSANYFQAVGKPTRAMTLAMTRQILFLLPLVVILPLFFGIDGIAYAGPISDIASLSLTLFFITRELRSLNSDIADGQAISLPNPGKGV